MKTVTHKSAAVPATGSAPARASTGSLAWGRLTAFVLRWRFALIVIAAVGLVAAGQFAEDLADSQPFQMLRPTFFSRRWTVIAAVLYMLLISRVMDRTVQRSLPSLQRVLKIHADTLASYARRLQPPDRRANLLVLGLSAFIVTLLFPVLGSDLPVTNDPVTAQPLYLPANASALVVLAGYTLIGWAGLSLVYRTIRLARALGEVCLEPMAIDVFNTTNLLPFGNMALAGALAPAGLIVILLLGLGQPNTLGSWTVLMLAALASVLALILPLRGVHDQMSNAKKAVIADFNARLSQVYAEVRVAAAEHAADMGQLSERTNTVILLRKAVQEMTTWPFADTVAFGRAVLIASAPIIYAALSELIRIFWINPLSR